MARSAPAGKADSSLYTPNADFCGQDSFEYTISDGSLTDVGTVTVNVACVNDLPRPQPDVFAVAEDSVGNVLDVLTERRRRRREPTSSFSGASPRAVGSVHGTVTVAANGTHVIYTPDPNFFGTASFVCKVTEGSGPGIDQPGALVTVTVTPVNDVPLAANDSYTLDRSTDTVLSVSAPGVLANDGDGDNPTLTAVQVTGPANGSLTLNADGSFIYTPNADFLGSDSFTYRAFDGTASSEVATVSITVNAENVSAAVGAGGTASTDDEADGATPADPVETSVTLPAGRRRIRVDCGRGHHADRARGLHLPRPAGEHHGACRHRWCTARAGLPSGCVNHSGGTQPGHAAGVPQRCRRCELRRGRRHVRIARSMHRRAGAARGRRRPAHRAHVRCRPLEFRDAGQYGARCRGRHVRDGRGHGADRQRAGNDNDVDNDTLTAALVGAPLAGLTFNADGSFTYTPAADFNGRHVHLPGQ